MRTTQNENGFTLIELSIVLVIIGLIVGGVLVGQDLIKGAEIRATVSQLEKFDAAANTFRNKYGSLPGDIENPGNFGFNSANIGANGNGRLNRGTDDDNGNLSYGEAVAFFTHLSEANLISQSFLAVADFSVPYQASLTDYHPSIPMDTATLLYTAFVDGGNQYFFFRDAYIDDTQTLGLDNGNDIRIIDAFQIDSKMDDGVANTGRVITVTDFVTSDNGTTCHISGVYKTAASANSLACKLRIRTSF